MPVAALAVRHLGMLGGVRHEQVEANRAAETDARPDRLEQSGRRGGAMRDDQDLRVRRRVRRASSVTSFRVMLRNATTTTIAPRNRKLVTVVPRPRPPSWRGWER